MQPRLPVSHSLYSNLQVGTSSGFHTLWVWTPSAENTAGEGKCQGCTDSHTCVKRIPTSLVFLYSRRNCTNPKSRRWQLRILPSATFQAGHQVCTKAAQTPHRSEERNHRGLLLRLLQELGLQALLGHREKFHMNFLSSPLPHLNL